ncbi:DUF3488 and transglutaminase-like domain-containing protein [Allobranchiibius sp. GilTou73]|uniref:transglutaminase family protein n=1 Tax=Allobranchiibius sp. GilTou73 TaxID=2904523 RepID=UPI001F272560|nr:DUF3488 and transglutaminase-like domain-containing protein [Allobranchiibius sp. GilTou73]UIJ33530.1 DUF3488 and transglutaminase-like domain-containing protein [Allobranchiibius sp. GilTou73]
MTRARPAQTFLAALATMIAAWPITTLFVGNAWIDETLGLVTLAALLGMAGRALDLPPMLTLSVQLIGVTAVTVVTHLHDHLDTSLPSALRALGADAHHTVTAYAAPAPSTVGVVFFIGLIIAIIAITVDFLAVSARSPGLAGVPLLVEFVISAANSGGSLHPRYSFALGLAWLAMLYAASERSARDWSGLRARIPGRPNNPTALLGGHDFGPFTRTAGVGALIAALVIAASLPAASQKFMANGLARGNGPATTVGFSTDLDLHNNLVDRDHSPVLTLRTADLNPPPLRALVADDYTGDHWVPARPSYLLRGVNGAPLQRYGQNTVPTTSSPYTMVITQNTMRPPYVVAPTQVASANFGGATWSYDPDTTQPSTTRLENSYTVRYLSQPASARPSSQTIDTTGFGPDLVVDQASKSRIDALVHTAAPSGTPFQRVIAIQDYFRDGDNFDYSLTLDPTRKDSADRPLDPISNFLVTRRGYCMQFATAMVMAARSIGVPARLGVGFLPGTVDSSGSYQVHQSDAHAWPELYFPGMGWTRFEPTPAARTGLAPPYASPTIGSPESAAPRRSASGGRTARGSDSTTSASGTTTPTSSHSVNLHLVWLLWVFAALLVLAAAFAVLPLLARWSRRRLQVGHGAADDAARVQAQWDDLVSRMEDLGIDPAPQVSPRSQEAHYRLHLVVGREGQESLHRAVDVLERVRYSPRPGPGDDLSAPADDLLMRIRRSRSFRTRVVATLFPRSGRRAVRSLFSRRTRR